MQRIMMFSSDCHASPLPETYRNYLEERFHPALEDDIRTQALDMEPISAAREDSSQAGQSDFEARSACATKLDIRLEAAAIDGFVGELIFPDNTVGNRVPFTGYWLCGTGPKQFWPDLWTAGLRAYNRWLGETSAGDRQLGVGLLAFHDPEYALAEVKRFRDLGLRGVMPQWDALDSDFPRIFDKRFDPVWAACVDEDLPVTFHPHVGRPNNFYPNSDDPPRKGAAVELEAAQDAMIYQTEDIFWTRRTLWHMIFGGVLERHPDLKVGFVEMYTDWIPYVLRRLDNLITRARDPELKFENQAQKFKGDRKGGRQAGAQQYSEFHRLLPSEYWKRQCFVGSHSTSIEEFKMRDEIGIENFTYGTDFPHKNSPWKQVKPYLRATMGPAGVSEAEARLILGENVARIYGVDVASLEPLVEKIGPLPEEVLGAENGTDLEDGFSGQMRWSAHHPSTLVM